MSDSARFSWNSARCNRLLRPLSSKIALLRKTTLSESRHDECTSRNLPPSSFPPLTAPTKNEIELEISPRPWKKIKRTYSSRTNGHLYRELLDHNDDRAVTLQRDAVIGIPLKLTADRSTSDDENSTVKDGQQDLLAQRALSRTAPGSLKNAQTFHGHQASGCAVSTGMSNLRLIEGIYKALEALLKATGCDHPHDKGGCRSLFSTCLRQIPCYIGEEQRRVNEEDPENDIDVASEVYSELEAFGAAPDGGWESLREVVRAHGLSLVREAIQEGLIEFPLAHHILSLCLGLAAYDEAECVIEGMIAGMKSRSPPSKQNTGLCVGLSQSVNKWTTSHGLRATVLTDEASRVAGVLKYYVAQSGRHGFMYHQLAVMLEDNTLPIHWISSKAMIECWNGVIRSITQQNDYVRSATLLLQVAISKSYKRGFSNAKAKVHVHDLRLRASEPTYIRPTLRFCRSEQKEASVVESRPLRSREADALVDGEDNAVHSTFSTILTVFSAINILRSPKSALDPTHPELLSLAIQRDMALEIRQALELANFELAKFAPHANCNRSVPAEQLHLPLLSAGLVSIVSRKAGTEISPGEVLDLATLASLLLSKDSMSKSGSFVCGIANCCDEAESGNGFRFIQVIVQDLISIANSNVYDKSTRRFCGGIAQAAAFAFSEDTGQAKHLDWALDIESTIARTIDESPKAVLDKTPAKALIRNKSGYKWEEGICEWIAKTPALVMPQPTAIEGIGVDSIHGEARKMTLVQALPLHFGHSECNTIRRLRRSKRRRGGRGGFCDNGAIGDGKKSCRNSISSERLLFIGVSPRSRKMACPQLLSKAEVVNDLDELSALDPWHEKAVALREVANPPSGLIRNSLDEKRNTTATGKHELDVPPRKRRCLDRENASGDTDDELGLP